jgi:hypothetical protein
MGVLLATAAKFADVAGFGLGANGSALPDAASLATAEPSAAPERLRTAGGSARPAATRRAAVCESMLCSSCSLTLDPSTGAWRSYTASLGVSMAMAMRHTKYVSYEPLVLETRKAVAQARRLRVCRFRNRV